MVLGSKCAGAVLLAIGCRVRVTGWENVVKGRAAGAVILLLTSSCACHGNVAPAPAATLPAQAVNYPRAQTFLKNCCFAGNYAPGITVAEAHCQKHVCTLLYVQCSILGVLMLCFCAASRVHMECIGSQHQRPRSMRRSWACSTTRAMWMLSP